LGIQREGHTWAASRQVAEGTKNVVECSDKKSALHFPQRIEAFFKDRKGYGKGSAGVVIYKLPLHRNEAVRWEFSAYDVTERKLPDLLFQNW
jgi:hypothetical protein